VVYHTGVGLNALYRGQPDLARRHFGAIPEHIASATFWHVSFGYLDYGIGLSYAWEGRFVLAAETLEPALARAEKQGDRNSQVACMIAAIFAHACLESGNDDQAHTLLAGKLEYIERFGVPEVIMASHRTLARLADKDGRQDVALDLLGSLRAIGESRGMIRLQVAALYELVQLHVLHGRIDTAAGYGTQLNALASAHSQGTTDPYSDWINLYSDLAHAQAALAPGGVRDIEEVLLTLDRATLAADRIQRGAESVEIRFLRAEALRQHGKIIDAQSVHEEAASLAQASGMTRILNEHGIARGPSFETFLSENAPLKAPVSDKEAVVRAAGILTLKEREVLTLLCRSLSNKEIALAMGIGEQTIKWHIKNLFAKLNAGTRKHAVARARLLGLVDF
ncbi:MAG: LuxR C-terminal-related transcriptional regulator, partial [Steroidobacteraceae bacterium]